MDKQILVLEELTKETAVDVFVDKGLDPYLEMITNEAKSFVGDTSTDKGRKAIASMARKVARSKTFLDGLGKDLNADAKKKAKVVDDVRKSMREYLDGLRDEVRAPLDEYEAKIKQLEQEQLSKYERLKGLCSTVNWEGERLSSAELSNSIIELKTTEVDSSYGDYELRAFKTKTEGIESLQRAIDTIMKEEQEVADKIEQERLAHIERERAIEEQRKIDLQNAKAEAEEKAKADAIIEAEKHESELIAQQEKAKRDAEEYERKLAAAAEAEKQAAINAEQKRIDDIAREYQLEIERKAAMEAAEKRAAEQERNRLAQIKVDEEAQAAARERNVEHKRKVNTEILNAICTECGFSEDEAKAIIVAIASRKVPHVSIQY